MYYNVPIKSDKELQKQNVPYKVKEKKREQVHEMGKRRFTAEFKANLVLEVLRGERELCAIASEHQINPNQLRAWKTAFLEKAATVFEDSKATREAARHEEELAREKAAMLKTIGQLTLERDFLMQQAHERNKGVYLRRE